MTEPEVMTGAALKVTLGGLGLPPSWFAKRVGVTMRTVVRWFDGDNVPPRVATEIAALQKMTLDEMRKTVSAVSSTDSVVRLWTYRTDKELTNSVPIKGLPAAWHRALTFRVAEHLRAQGRSVTVEYR